MCSGRQNPREPRPAAERDPRGSRWGGPPRRRRRPSGGGNDYSRTGAPTCEGQTGLAVRTPSTLSPFRAIYNGTASINICLPHPRDSAVPPLRGTVRAQKTQFDRLARDSLLEFDGPCRGETDCFPPLRLRKTRVPSRFGKIGTSGLELFSSSLLRHLSSISRRELVTICHSCVRFEPSGVQISSPERGPSSRGGANGLFPRPRGLAIDGVARSAAPPSLSFR